MKSLAIALFFVSAMHCSAKHEVDIQKIKTALENENIDKAVALVQEAGSTDLYRFGRRLAKDGHTDAALSWFVQLTLKYDNPEYYYGRAWIHWTRREIGDAKHCAQFILKEGAPKVILARAHYLLGLIFYNNFEYEKAHFHADQSEIIYKECNKNGGLYLANILRAGIAIRSKDFDSGRRSIEVALEYNDKISNPYPLGRAYELYSEMAFVSADYRKALEYAEKSRDEYFQDKMNDNGWSLNSRMGLCYALLGDFGAAYDIAQEVDTYSREHKLNKVLIYNHFTWIYMYKCRNQDYSAHMGEVNRWVAMKKSGKEMDDLLEFVLTVSCPN